MKLRVNGKDTEVDVPSTTPLLWVIREELGLTGTKFGCGAALCGACTVHVDGQARRSCVTAVADVVAKDITTIEGLPNKASSTRFRRRGSPRTSPSADIAKAARS